MSKWMSVAVLGAVMVACGCESMNKKDKSTTQPMKMSADASKKCADGKSCCDKK